MSLDSLSEIAFQYWAQLDCPKSLKLYLLAKSGDWVGVHSEKVNPVDYNDAKSYAQAAAAVAFIKKNPNLPGLSASERRANAVKAWRKGEQTCYQANERLSRFVISPLADDVPSEFLRRVRGWLLCWLRGSPSDEEIHQKARHGPGTTFSSSVANPTAADKYSERPTLTHEATWYLASVVGTKWGGLMASKFQSSSRDCVSFTRGNRFTTAPKTGLTDRPIAVEASINIWFQLALGSCIRDRMKKFARWDLNHVADKHREAARKSSIDDSFATIDLSNASDSLCKNLVRILLRDTKWLERLEDLRSSRTFIDKRWHLLEKFSSMGNGYTFELETVIFAALCAECLVLRGYVPEFGKNLFVFGDDIIVPKDCASLVVATLKWCGFETNSEKTFLTGPFKESCGGDFFDGAPVRGFYLKGVPLRDSQQIFTLHNGAKKSLENSGINSPWFLGWIRQRHLSLGYRSVGGQDRLSDSVLHGVPERFRWREGVRWVRCVKWSEPVTVKWRYFDYETRLACRLTGYGHTFGIDSRGVKAVAELTWVTDS